MKISINLLLLAICSSSTTAFAPSSRRATIVQQKSTVVSEQQRNFQLFSQWEDEEEDVFVADRQSFEDAGASLKDEDDKKKMDEMGDFDANPAYKSDDIDRVREAIRQRTESLGIEKSKVTEEAIKAAEERAKAGVANGGNSFEQQLDLSQISQEAPRGQDDSTPAMFYEPEKEMTEEEMVEADPDRQLSIPDQAMKEINASTWPTIGAAFREVLLLIFVVAFTSALIIGWDSTLREIYTSLGFIPKPEDIMQGNENMALPEGWTNGMTEEDFMNFQDEVSSSLPPSP